jgi:hypothetical protein
MMKQMDKKIKIIRFILIGVALIIFIPGILDDNGVINIFVPMYPGETMNYYLVPILSINAISLILPDTFDMKIFKKPLFCSFIGISTIVFLTGCIALFIPISRGLGDFLNFAAAELVLIGVIAVICVYFKEKNKKQTAIQLEAQQKHDLHP